MSMLIYLSRRLGKGALVLLAIAIANFFLVRLAPGDPAQVMAGEAGAGDELFLMQLRAAFGLDKSISEQLWIYLKGILTLDLGFSYRQQKPVLELIAARLPATLLLTGVAFAGSLLIGTLVGVLSARRAGSWLDTGFTVLALLFFASPLFWVALMAILLFSVYLEWLPSFGFETIGAGLTGWARIADIASHLFLPAATLTLFFMAVYMRMTRSSMLEVARLDYVKTARAKGVPENLVVRRHILRNALLPIVTLAGLQAGQMVGGAILTETVFAWPGIGRLMFESIAQRDYAILLGIFFISSAMVVLFNILTDLAYGLVDPRIELGR